MASYEQLSDYFTSRSKSIFVHKRLLENAPTKQAALKLTDISLNKMHVRRSRVEKSQAHY